MTKVEVRAIEGQAAMNELDRRMAEVMGWVLVADSGGQQWYYLKDKPEVFAGEVPASWHPTRSIEQAFQVVERMRGLGYDFSLWYNDSGFWAVFPMPPQVVIDSDNALHVVRGLIRENAAQPAKAICKAALAALKAVEKG